ncbi:MAG: carboxynorspermidine decarboxylase [Lachnospiraceae bacterium]
MTNAFQSEKALRTPYFLVEEVLLRKNLEILKGIMDETGCHILLAQKCFSMYHTYPLIGEYLSGTTASGLYEARLGHTYMGKENHVFSAAYREDEIEELFEICDHIVFNSLSQWIKYQPLALRSGKKCGLRINPECSTQDGHAIYDPCAPYSRMGVTRVQLEAFLKEIGKTKEEVLRGISGFHFHTLCEQDSDALEVTIQSVEEKFGDLLPDVEWLNFGGGHHITKPSYDRKRLKKCIRHMQKTYDLEIYLEPGEAVALDAGFLTATVLDVTKNGKKIAILDTSAACHMPDVLEMPYTPEIIGAKIAEEADASNENLYRLGGPTCLAGDVIGEYVFEKTLQPGNRLTFCDMAIYSMVKTNTFNGMPLPSIYYKRADGTIEEVRTFGYEDFRGRI